jgi:hypothetical protein
MRVATGAGRVVGEQDASDVSGESPDARDTAIMNKLDRLTAELRRLGIVFHEPAGTRE